MIGLPPPTLEIRRFADLLGHEGLLLFLERFAGQRIYVPRTTTEHSEISKEVGLDIARALSAEYGGQYLKVPVAREWRVLVYKSQGVSYRQMAKRLGCSEDAIWLILSKNQATQSQLSLF